MLSRFFAIVCLLFVGRLQASEAVLMQVIPDRPLAHVHPHQDVLGLTIQAQHADGSPVTAGVLHLHLKAPDTPWLASTDFPVVEGSDLLDATVQLDQGAFRFQFAPPIRGTYTLSLSLEPLPGDSSFLPSKTEWQATLSESAQKKLNLSILLLILVGVGSISGFILGRTRPAALLLLLGLVCWPSGPADAHGDETHGTPRQPTPVRELASEGGERVDLKLLTPQPRVGQLARLSASYGNAQGLLRPARFRLRFIQLEHQKEVFSTEVLAPQGILNWQGQFYDGSDHRVVVEAVPLSSTFDQHKPAQSELDVGVTAIAPPTRAIVKSFGFLLGLTALALFLGLCVGRMLPRHEGRLI